MKMKIFSKSMSIMWESWFVVYTNKKISQSTIFYRFCSITQTHEQLG